MRSAEKLGVVFANQEVSFNFLIYFQKTTLIFNYYDRSGDGRIDYKEFSAILIEGGKTGADVEREAALDAIRVKSKQAPQQNDDEIISPQ